MPFPNIRVPFPNVRVPFPRFGKSTHISMIINCVTHPWSYTNSAIADMAINSAPISPVTLRDCRAASTVVSASSADSCIEWPPRHRRRRCPKRRRLHIERRYLLIERRYRRIEWWVFHAVLTVFHVLWLVHDVLQCIIMFYVFHNVLLCLTMFYDV